MIYPAYVHLGDDKHAHGITLPDFPGCFSAADDYADIPSKIQEAVELYTEGEVMELPTASKIEALETSGEFEGGVWMLIDIDTNKLMSKPMRLNVSLPSHVVARMDAYASEHHMTRSALIVKAAEQLLSSKTP